MKEIIQALLIATITIEELYKIVMEISIMVIFPYLCRKEVSKKIIDPDGRVTIENTSSGAHDYLNEINRLNQRIQDLERIISGHEATIKSKDDLICILKSALDKK